MINFLLDTKMLNTIYATKIGMTQAWSKDGKRLVVTKCKVGDNLVVGVQKIKAVNKDDKKNHNLQTCRIFEIGYGKKKFKNLTKPLQEKLKKSGFSNGIAQIRGVKSFSEELTLKPGDTLKLADVLEVGDVIKVQGISKGKGFAGVMKRHGFHGGPRTHGQSDRERAPGSIGNRTDPGRVWKGKKMPGHMGAELKTVSGLKVLYIDEENKEIWLSGPVPGFNSSFVRISKTGDKVDIALNAKASGIVEKQTEETKEVKVEAKQEKPATKEEVKEKKVDIKEAVKREKKPVKK